MFTCPKCNADRSRVLPIDPCPECGAALSPAKTPALAQVPIADEISQDEIPTLAVDGETARALINEAEEDATAASGTATSGTAASGTAASGTAASGTAASGGSAEPAPRSETQNETVELDPNARVALPNPKKKPEVASKRAKANVSVPPPMPSASRAKKPGVPPIPTTPDAAAVKPSSDAPASAAVKPPMPPNPVVAAIPGSEADSENKITDVNAATTQDLGFAGDDDRTDTNVATPPPSDGVVASSAPPPKPPIVPESVDVAVPDPSPISPFDPSESVGDVLTKTVMGEATVRPKKTAKPSETKAPAEMPDVFTRTVADAEAVSGKPSVVVSSMAQPGSVEAVDSAVAPPVALSSAAASSSTDASALAGSASPFDPGAQSPPGALPFGPGAPPLPGASLGAATSQAAFEPGAPNAQVPDAPPFGAPASASIAPTLPGAPAPVGSFGTPSQASGQAGSQPGAQASGGAPASASGAFGAVGQGAAPNAPIAPGASGGFGGNPGSVDVPGPDVPPGANAPFNGQGPANNPAALEAGTSPAFGAPVVSPAPPVAASAMPSAMIPRPPAASVVKHTPVPPPVSSMPSAPDPLAVVPGDYALPQVASSTPGGPLVPPTQSSSGSVHSPPPPGYGQAVVHTPPPPMNIGPPPDANDHSYPNAALDALSSEEPQEPRAGQRAESANAVWRQAHPSAQRWAAKRSTVPPRTPRPGIIAMGLVLAGFGTYLLTLFLPSKAPLTAAEAALMAQQAGVDEGAWRFSEQLLTAATLNAALFVLLGVVVVLRGAMHRQAPGQARRKKMDKTSLMLLFCFALFAISFLALVLSASVG